MSVVAHVGGLVDTVIDANPAAHAAEVATAIQFAPVTAAGLEPAIARTARLWQQPKAWARMQRCIAASSGMGGGQTGSGRASRGPGIGLQIPVAGRAGLTSRSDEQRSCSQERENP